VLVNVISACTCTNPAAASIVYVVVDSTLIPSIAAAGEADTPTKNPQHNASRIVSLVIPRTIVHCLVGGRRSWEPHGELLLWA
jgi:hypothetical protein